VFFAFKDFVAKSEAHFNLKMVNLYIDNGREYLSNEMREFCVEKGIGYHLTVPHTPKLNGVAERMIRTITENARSMINCTKLNKSFWGEAVLTATYLVNRSPSRALENIRKTPYGMWHKKKPILKCLKIFESTIYALNEVRKRKFMIARDLVVDENTIKSMTLNENDSVVKQNDVSRSHDSPMEENVELDFPSQEMNESMDSKSGENSNESSTCLENTDPVVEAGDNIKENENQYIRRSERIKDKPKLSYRFLEKCLINTQLCLSDIPNTYEEIKFRNDRTLWEEAIQDELNSHFVNNTWCLVQRPMDKNIV